MLVNYSPKLGTVDKTSWEIDTHDGFSVKALRKAIEGTQGGVVGNSIGTTCLNEIPKKVYIFCWRAKLDRIPTRLVLDKMVVDLDSSHCPRCGAEVESIDHALIRCEKVRKL